MNSVKTERTLIIPICRMWTREIVNLHYGEDVQKRKRVGWRKLNGTMGRKERTPDYTHINRISLNNAQNNKLGLIKCFAFVIDSTTYFHVNKVKRLVFKLKCLISSTFLKWTLDMYLFLNFFSYIIFQYFITIPILFLDAFLFI